MSSNDRNERRVHIDFKPNKSIDNTSNLFFIGSCFGEEIHKKMIEIGHSNSISNPFGTIFHPIPLLENLERIVLNKTCTAEEIYTQSQARYQQGLAPLTEILNAETSLRESKNNVLSALFQVRIAELDLLHANGQLIKFLQ
jgi:hypothetical protein